MHEFWNYNWEVVRGMYRQKVLLFIAIAGLLIYASVYFVMPLRTRVANNEQVIFSLTRKLELARQSAEDKDQLNREVQDLKARLKLLNKMVPPEVGNAEVIIILSSLAEKCSIHQSHISESQEARVPSDQLGREAELPVNTFLWKGSGYYEDIKRFLKALEESERLLGISDIKLIKQTEAGFITVAGEPALVTEPQLSLSFHVKTYYDQPDGGLGGDIASTEIDHDTQGKSNPFR